MIPLVAGAYDRKKYLGRLAEWCPFCQQITVCRVREHRQVSHVYFIPLGRGKVTGHSLHCDKCHRLLPADSSCATQAIDVGLIALEQLVELTNPDLPERVGQQQARFELAAQGLAEPYERMELLFDAFHALEFEAQEHPHPWLPRPTSLLLFMLNLAVAAGLVALLVLGWVSWVWIVPTLVAWVAVVIYLLLKRDVLDSHEHFVRRYGDYLAYSVAPLQPTREELTRIRRQLHERKLAVAKLLHPRHLHPWLQQASHNPAPSASAY